MTLKEYIDRHSVNMSAFARNCHCSHTWIYGIINGKFKPSAQLASVICKLTDGKVTLNELGIEEK